jgi:hypothetical protein
MVAISVKYPIINPAEHAKQINGFVVKVMLDAKA